MFDREDDISHRINYVGTPLDYVQIKIVDTNGNMVKLGDPSGQSITLNNINNKFGFFGLQGEIYVKSYGHMLEYYQDDEKTKEAYANKWYKTGSVTYN